MILVDIQVPMLDGVYDFELEETAAVKGLLREIVGLIAGEEGLTLRDEERMQLYAVRQGYLLDKNVSLKQQGVEAGDRLVLI